MIYKKDKGIEFTLPGGTNGVIYQEDKELDQTIAYVELDGVYPEKGWSVNDRCTETLFVVDGNLQVFLGSERYEVSGGDLLPVKPGVKYKMTGKAKVVDFITPRWDSNQNHIIN